MIAVQRGGFEVEDGAEGLGHLGCALEAIFGALGHSAAEQIGEGLAEEVGRHGGESWGEVGDEDLGGGASGVGEASGEHEVGDAADGVEVGGRGDVAGGGGLLGGHEGGGAEGVIGEGEGLADLLSPALSDGLGDAEVEDFDDSSAAARGRARCFRA
jgi:hypothetical protein